MKRSLRKPGNMTVNGVADKCLNFDMYGRRIALTYNGQDKFRTKFGAFCTILVGLIVTCYAMFKSLDLLQREHALPIRSQIFYESFYEMYEEVAGVRERDGSVNRIEKAGELVRPQ